VRFLRSRLESMSVVDRPPSDRSRVYFGARVTLETDAGEQRRYRIVGPDELDMGADHISMDAPLGRALLGKRLDEEIVLTIGERLDRYTVVAVEYPDY